MNVIDGKGRYRMRDGRKAIVYGPAHREPGRFAGHIEGVTFVYTWAPDGSWGLDGKESHLDIMERV